MKRVSRQAPVRAKSSLEGARAEVQLAKMAEEQPSAGMQVIQKRAMTPEEAGRFKESARAQAFERRPEIAIQTGSVQRAARALRVAERYPAGDFTGIRIAFENHQARYSWGPWLQRVNGQPYQLYLRQNQGAVDVETPGTDPYFPPGSPNKLWGNIIFNIIALEFSSRFGGSFHITLAPEEDFGIELADRQKGLFLDLHRWLLHLYVRPTMDIFNIPAGASNLLNTAVNTEIEAFETEAYEVVNGKLVPSSGTFAEQDIATLISAAATESVGKLLTLSKFILGFVHEQKLGDFNSVAEKVTRMLISDGLCSFETELKVPFVAVRMRSSYLGTGSLEGLFDGDPELTAEPWIILSEKPFVVLSAERKKYIGGASQTPFLTMGILPLDQIARVNEVTAFVSWTEDDPVSDDFGGSGGFVFDVGFDLAELQSRADNNDLGKVGETLSQLRNDQFHDWLTYGVEIEFDLVKL